MPIKSSPAPLAISEIVAEFGDAAGGSDSLSEYYRGVPMLMMLLRIVIYQHPVQ